MVGSGFLNICLPFREESTKDNFRIGDHTPATCWWQWAESMLLTNSDLSAHAIDQLLGIVADPGLKHCLHVLDLVNAF